MHLQKISLHATYFDYCALDDVRISVGRAALEMTGISVKVLSTHSQPSNITTELPSSFEAIPTCSVVHYCMQCNSTTIHPCVYMCSDTFKGEDNPQ